jgi:hypothetical protein
MSKKQNKSMKTRHLNIEISEFLFKQLENLAELTEESIDDLVIQIIAKNILFATRTAEDLKGKLELISSDNIPELIETGELTGVEIF